MCKCAARDVLLPCATGDNAVEIRKIFAHNDSKCFGFVKCYLRFLLFCSCCQQGEYPPIKIRLLIVEGQSCKEKILTNGSRFVLKLIS